VKIKQILYKITIKKYVCGVGVGSQKNKKKKLFLIFHISAQATIKMFMKIIRIMIN
jgi:hypothetical protein